MRNKGVSSAVIVVAVIVTAAVAAGGYMIMSGDEEGGVENIAWKDVSSLKLKAKDIDNMGNVTGKGTVWIKNIRTQNRKSKLDIILENSETGELSVEYKIIVNEEVENAWYYFNENWIPTENFEDTRKEFLTEFITQVENNFSRWSRGENITITEHATTTKLYDIEINPNPEDLLFEDPTA